MADLAMNKDGPVSGQSYVIFGISDNSGDVMRLVRRRKIEHKMLAGRWKDILETCVLVNVKDWHSLRDHVFAAGEDCVLLLGPVIRRGIRPAILLYNYGLPESIGYFRSVSETEAKLAGDYTYDPSMEAYFVAEHNVPDLMI